MRVKPQCRKCGVAHWPFYSCADAPAENAREEAKAAAQAARAMPVRVLTDPRSEWGGTRLSNFDQSVRDGVLWKPTRRAWRPGRQ